MNRKKDPASGRIFLLLSEQRYRALEIKLLTVKTSRGDNVEINSFIGLLSKHVLTIPGYLAFFCTELVNFVPPPVADLRMDLGKVICALQMEYVIHPIIIGGKNIRHNNSGRQFNMDLL